LFLYNNLHAVHHDRPGLPWYRIPAYYRANREAIVTANGGLVYNGYADVIGRYLLTPHHEGPHPGYATPRAALPHPRLRRRRPQLRTGYPSAEASVSKANTAS
jgi:fatty acid desaturase